MAGVETTGDIATGESHERDALLLTKLHAPRARASILSRRHLFRRLEESGPSGLTLVSAPAGSGKTTLLAGWAEHADKPVAWVLLDAGDNDPVRFWRYMLAAMSGVHTGLGSETAALLDAPQPPPMESVLTTLVNELDTIPGEIGLVLDDYHVIESRSIHADLTFLIEHQPPNLHLIIATRADPPLPLARLRARGQLTELRSADLRFTRSEAAAFLRDLVGVELSSTEIAALEERTEGWAAGLQLAALAMRDRTDITDFIAAFAGGHRHVVDYLVEEVLDRQSEDVRDFLLDTSILERLSGALCDDVTARAGGQEMLESLERGNLFITALDGQRRWYRYHHLFADLLRARLLRTRPETVPQLHGHACAWYERNGMLPDAIGHALSAGDHAWAARLVGRAAGPMLQNGEPITLLGWLDALPDDLVPPQPRLCLLRAWALAIVGRLDEVESCLQDAERALVASGVADSDVPGEVRSIRGEIAAVRANVAGSRGDVPRTIDLARQALELLPQENARTRAIVAVSLGEAYRLAGEPASAHRAYQGASAVARQLGYTLIAEVAMAGLAQVEEIKGNLRRADVLYGRALEWAVERGSPGSPGTGLLHVGLGRVRLEWNDLASAHHHLLTGMELCRRGDIRETLLDGYIALSRLRRAEGSTAEARDALREAEGLAASNERFAERLETELARLSLILGDVEAAVGWARDRDLTPTGVRGDLPEPQSTLLARILLARGQLEDELDLLGQLLHDAEAAGRTGSVIELLILRAVALRAAEDRNGALAALEGALSLAEPGGYLRIFLDEGPVMAALLAEFVRTGRDKLRDMRHRALHGYARRVLAAFDPASATDTATIRSGDGAARRLPEPLTAREMEVLRLVAAGLSNAEIASRLVVATSTVKWYVHGIFGKLGVESRTAAVARARELDLIAN